MTASLLGRPEDAIAWVILNEYTFLFWFLTIGNLALHAANIFGNLALHAANIFRTMFPLLQYSNPSPLPPLRGRRRLASCILSASGYIVTFQRILVTFLLLNVLVTLLIYNFFFAVIIWLLFNILLTGVKSWANSVALKTNYCGRCELLNWVGVSSRSSFGEAQHMFKAYQGPVSKWRAIGQQQSSLLSCTIRS